MGPLSRCCGRLNFKILHNDIYKKISRHKMVKLSTKKTLRLKSIYVLY